jgi:hypothetical protein
MKKIIVVMAVAMSLLTVTSSKAQLSINVGINIGSQPVWGPVGYDHVDYYYLPDIESYYYVPRHQYVYLNAGQWIFSASLPSRYASYDVERGYKVVMNESRPYIHFNEHRIKYVQYKGYKHQDFIRNSNDPRYYVVKGHPKKVMKIMEMATKEREMAKGMIVTNLRK